MNNVQYSFHFRQHFNITFVNFSIKVHIGKTAHFIRVSTKSSMILILDGNP